MKTKLSIILACLSFGIAAQDSIPQMQNRADSLSYFLGLGLGYELQNPPFDSNTELLLQGFNEAILNEAHIDPMTAKGIFQELQMAMQQDEERQALLEEEAALEENRLWFEENGAREGVMTTASGLQYEILTRGDGPLPADTSMVRVHYEGKLTDGTVFDSSWDRGEAISFPLNQVIGGWSEGLQLMNVGSTHMLYIPPKLGYGSRGAGSIPPNSILIFKVELLAIE